MEASLAVPTATSFREVPAKLLEVNRRIINGYLGRTQGGKVSFTHLIGYAVVRAIADEVPAMNASYLEVDGKPRLVRHEHLGLGLAVDVAKDDGSRTLLVPCIRDADTLDFRGFWAAYEEIISKVRNNKLSPDDFAGTTVSLTNPGTIGTERSVPRLMPGQGLIVGVGRLDYPAAYEAADPRVLADLGLSKVITVSSTYDHRIIQGAESGLFLKRVHDLLLGEDDFYEDAFRSLGVPYEAVQWRPDIHPLDRDQAMLDKQMQVNSVINAHRVRGHLIADLDPLAAKEPHMHAELDPATYGLTIWDLDREFLTGEPRRQHRPAAAGRDPADPAGRLLPPDRHRVHAHPGAGGEALDPGARRGRSTRSSAPTSTATSSSASTRPRPSSSSWASATSARSASGWTGPSPPSPSSTPCSRRRPRRAWTARCWAWPTGAGSTC